MGESLNSLLMLLASFAAPASRSVIIAVVGLRGIQAPESRIEAVSIIRLACSSWPSVSLVDPRIDAGLWRSQSSGLHPLPSFSTKVWSIGGEIIRILTASVCDAESKCQGLIYGTMLRCGVLCMLRCRNRIRDIRQKCGDGVSKGQCTARGTCSESQQNHV